MTYLNYISLVNKIHKVKFDIKNIHFVNKVTFDLFMFDTEIIFIQASKKVCLNETLKITPTRTD